MIPINFPESTGSLGPPPSVSDKDCGRLPFRRGNDGNYVTLTSVWEPTDEELISIKSGGKIQITLFSDAHPMMSVGVYRRPKLEIVDDS